MAEHNEVGKWGEEFAVTILENKGYSILERDWSMAHKDLDIVAMSPDGTEIVFVEVKTRSTEELLEPELAVDRKKIRNLARVADSYLRQYPYDIRARFDIITVIGTHPSNAVVNHIEHAFNPLLFL